MAIKVRLFLDGKQYEASQLIINNVTVNRIVNDIVDNNNAASQGKTEEVA